jgi:D-glycero-D-manno-heptose 1,7-bisphosphate phosphatase
MPDVDYCSNASDVDIFAGVPEALGQLKQHGFKIFVVTNQSGIGRGYFSDAQYRIVEAEVARQLGSNLIDATYYCPHKPDENCACRKPATGMILEAERKHQLDLARSFLIGDKNSDIDCGRDAGIRTILVRTGYGEKAATESAADWIARDLTEAVDIILRHADE